ncbi:MAG: metalloregulator ArsR/SmtB family transcription factor [Candidatus Dormiibacterota bacterium]|jgi:ArsR family transcriptional regulator
MLEDQAGREEEDRRRDAEAFRLHAELCKVLTDPKRLMILQALRTGELCVGELAGIVGMSLPNASQHLSVLRHAGLVSTRRGGTTVYYSMAEPRIAQACDIVHQIVLERHPEARPRRAHPVTRPVVVGAAAGSGQR